MNASYAAKNELPNLMHCYHLAPPEYVKDLDLLLLLWEPRHPDRVESFDLMLLSFHLPNPMNLDSILHFDCLYDVRNTVSFIPFTQELLWQCI